MALAAGDKLGPYEIHAPIGAGGMGEVYKALRYAAGPHGGGEGAAVAHRGARGPETAVRALPRKMKPLTLTFTALACFAQAPLPELRTDAVDSG